MRQRKEGKGEGIPLRWVVKLNTLKDWVGGEIGKRERGGWKKCSISFPSSFFLSHYIVSSSELGLIFLYVCEASSSLYAPWEIIMDTIFKSALVIYEPKSHWLSSTEALLKIIPNGSIKDLNLSLVLCILCPLVFSAVHVLKSSLESHWFYSQKGPFVNWAKTSSPCFVRGLRLPPHSCVWLLAPGRHA